MTTFHVGQRVRIVRANNIAEMLGREAIVIGPLYNARVVGRDGRTYMKYCHDVDVSGFGRIAPNGLKMAAPPGALEPIIPEGAQPAEWSACEWQPEHMRTPA